MIGQRHRDRHVDADHADIDAVREIARRVAVAGIDRGAVAVFVVHGQLDRILVGRGANRGQDRAKDLGLVDVHVGGHAVEQVGADKEAVLIALQVEVAAVHDQLGALIHAGLDQAQDVLLGGLGHDRAVIDVVAGGPGADLQLFDARDQLFDQRVGGLVAHRHRDRNRHAAFARGPETRTDQRVGGLVQVGVGHDDHVVLGTAETLRALSGRGGAFIDVLRDRGRADKAHGLDDLAVQDRVNRVLVAVHHLQHAVRQARLLQQLGQHQGHRRVALGRFQDHRVTGGQGGAHFPQRDHGGKVEGRDARDHAQGLAHGIHVDAGTGAVGELTLQQVGRADAELDHLQAALDVALGVGEGLAVFGRQRLGQLVHVAVDQADKGHHHAGAALRVGGAPCDLGLGGAGDGIVHLGLGDQRQAGLNLTGGGVEDVGKPARGALVFLAVDPVMYLFHRILLQLLGAA